MYSHGHFWFVKNQFFWNFCFSVKDAEKFIKHHLFIYKRFTTDQNFKGVTQKLRLLRPWQVQNWPNFTMPFYYVKVPKWKKWVDPCSCWSKISLRPKNQVSSSKKDIFGFLGFSKKVRNVRRKGQKSKNELTHLHFGQKHPFTQEIRSLAQKLSILT